MSYPNELNYSAKRAIPNQKISVLFNIKNLLETIKTPNVFKIINTSALFTAYLSAVKDYIQPLLVNVALIIPFMLDIEKDKKNALIIAIIYFFIYLATSYASKFSSKFMAKNKQNVAFVTLFSGFCFGIISGIFYIYNIWIFSTIAFIGIYIIENIRKPILTGFIADNVPNEILTSVISAQSLLKTIFTAGLAFMLGFMADRYGIGASFLISSSFLILSTILIHIYSNQRHNSNPHKK
jgi:hypothetical protein